MTFEVIVAGGLVLIVVLILVGGFVAAFLVGKADDVKEESRDATRKLERHNDPLPTDAEYGARLRRISKRLARLRDRKAE